jgi:hypothetical protein
VLKVKLSSFLTLVIHNEVRFTLQLFYFQGYHGLDGKKETSIPEENQTPVTHPVSSLY